MKIIDLFKQVQLIFLRKASSERKVKFLRKQGMIIGENCSINTMAFSTEPYLIEIGDHVAIANGTDIITHDGGVWNFREELGPLDIFGKVKIGNNVFIGDNCTILPNTIIGDNCIIGAGSVVRGKFSENSVIIGNPAKVVLKANVQRFLYLQNPNLLKTQNLTASEKKKVLKKHFGLY
jgi:acetyltransferase-like isoleucine patch superfamily enzyme